MVMRLIFSIAGIYASFLTWAFLQERVSTTPYGDGDKFTFFVFLNLVQSICAAVVAYIYMSCHKAAVEGFSLPLVFSYLKVAFIHSISSPFGYASLDHIDYPTLTLGKSCKLIPVITMNYILYRRVYPFYKYVSVILITLGVSAFMLLHSSGKSKQSNSLYGLFMLSINLALDGATNSAQDHIFKNYRISGPHMMFYMNLFSAVLMFIYHLSPFGDNLMDAIAFCTSHPKAVWDILLFSVCGATGQCFIFYILEVYGSVTVVTVTVTRKLFTILISVIWFNHPLAVSQWIAVALVFSGIGLDAYMKTRESKKKIKTTSIKDGKRSRSQEKKVK